MTPEEFKKLRSRIEMTQAALGEAVGVTGNTVARWERGESTVPVAVAKLVRLMAQGGSSVSAVNLAPAVVRDPFHRDIIEALSQQIEPDSFEACAADLLRREHPGLVEGGGRFRASRLHLVVESGFQDSRRDSAYHRSGHHLTDSRLPHPGHRLG